MKTDREILREIIDEHEKCVMCGALTDVPKNMHIDLRKHYVEGAGQLCNNCGKEHE
jgi:hypothetical protein